jgi:DNA polymerase V
MGALGKIYRPGYRYTQGGVILSDFREPRYRQRELFDDGACERRAKYERLSRAVDMINDRFGEMALYPAELAAPDKKWRPRMEYR